MCTTFAFIGVACAAPAPPASAGPPPDLVLLNVNAVRLEGGKVAARGRAGELRYRRADGIVDFAQPSVDLPGGASVPGRDRGAVHVRAREATASLERKILEARGDVRLETDAGDVATTRAARYLGVEKRIVSDSPLEASGPQYRVSSGGLVADVAAGSVRFTGDVRAAGLPPAGAR